MVAGMSFTSKVFLGASATDRERDRSCMHTRNTRRRRHSTIHALAVSAALPRTSGHLDAP